MAESKPSAADFIAPTDPDQLIVWLDKKRAKARAGLPTLQMKMNLAYVLGHQWIVWDERSSSFRRPTRRTDEPNAPVRITANKIGGIVERFIARLTKSAPEPETRPVTDNEDDLGAAKAGTRILQSEMQRLNWEDWLVRHYFWTATHGWSYAQVMWDPSAGPEIGTVSAPGSADPTSVNEGEIVLESVPAFELVADPDAPDMRHARWAIRTKSLTAESIFEAYGKVPEDATPERTIADEVNSLSNAGKSEANSSTGDRFGVHQLWMLPCRAAPKGLVVTWCGKTVLEDAKPFPYHHGRLPFVQFDLLPGLGRREGRTWVDDLLPLQADYNDARSREATIRRTLVPKILAATGAIDTKAVTSRVEVIPYAQVGEKPSWMIPDSGWLAQYETSMNRTDMEMGDRAGQSDVSSGKPSTGSQPAAAILALQEADDTKLAITFKLMSAGIKDTAWQVLELVRQFWATDRLVRTYSEEGAIEVAYFSSADVSGQLDIQVSTESGTTRSKSAMVQLAMDLWNAQIISDPRYLLRLIDMPGTAFLAEAYNIDSKQACRENGLLLQGEQLAVNTFDNHIIHIKEHDDERKGEQYAKLKERSKVDPLAAAAVAAIDAHVQVHYEMVLPQHGVPTPPGTPYAPGAPGVPTPGVPPDAPGDNAGVGEYLDPMTGKPADPTAAAAGATPSALTDSTIANRAGIGGPGEPGRIEGVSADIQAGHMGA